MLYKRIIHFVYKLDTKITHIHDVVFGAYPDVDISRGIAKQ